MELHTNTSGGNSESVADWFRTQPPDRELRILTGYFSLGSLAYLWSVLPPNTTVRIVAQAEIKTAQLTTAQLLASEAAGFEETLQDAGIDSATEPVTLSGVPLHEKTPRGADSDMAVLKEVYDALGNSLQIRIHTDVHAKVYLTEISGLFGSSNLTRGGLERNIEFNATLDEHGYQTAEQLFTQTWAEAEPFSERLAHLLEASPVGRRLVDLPIADRETLQRAYGIATESILDGVVDRSLAGQLPQLSTQTPPPKRDTDSPHSRYYTDLLTEAARRRGGEEDATGFIQFRKQCPSDTHQLWQSYRQSADIDSLPLEPTGDLWLLDWYLKTDVETPVATDVGNQPVLLVEPWENQQHAFDAWVENGRTGIVEMATATGKTIVGLEAIADLCGIFPGYGEPRTTDARILVVVHSQALRDQWNQEITSKLGITDEGPPAETDFAGEPTTRATAVDANGGIVTSDPERTIWFDTGHIEIQTPQYIGRNPDAFRHRAYDLVIYDEVHHYARKEGWGASLHELSRTATLGLSATIEGPARRVLSERLGEIVYTYDLQQAQRDGILPPFDWVLHPVALTEDERAQVHDLKTKIAMGITRVNEDPRTATTLANLAENEALTRGIQDSQTEFENLGEFVQIYQTAQQLTSKDDLPESWLRLIKPIRAKRDILYTSDEAMAETITLAHSYLDEDLKLIIFSMRVDTAEAIADALSPATVIHGQLPEDQKLAVLNHFRSQQTGALVAAQMLDKGIDVPDADIGINAAGTKSQLQLIQRIGRLLRREGQTKAVFHHFVPQDELAYYRTLGPIEPRISESPTPTVEQRLPHRVGPVQTQELLSNLSAQDAERLLQADDLANRLEQRRDATWWLHILADEYPETFRDYLRKKAKRGSQ